MSDDFEMEVVENDELGKLAGDKSSSGTEEKKDTESTNDYALRTEEGASMLTSNADTNHEWRREPLETVSDIIMGSSPKSEYYNESGEGPPFLQANNEFGYRTPTADRWCSKPAKRCERGDLLMTIRGTYVGQMNLADDGYCIGRGLAAIVPGEELNGEYLFHYLNHIESYVKSIAAGSTFDSVSSGDIESLEVEVPPLPEQRKIASVLYAVDQAIQKTEEIIEQSHRVKRGLVQDLFHGKGEAYEAYKSTPVGEVPSHWSVTNIGAVVEMAQYGISESMSEDGMYPIFRMNNIENGYMVGEPMKYIDLDDSEFEKYRVKKGDILFNRTNSLELVGKTGIFELEGDYVFASYLVRLRANEEVDPYYLNYYMNSFEGQNRMMDFATKGVSQANINANSIQQVKLPLPPKNEQQDIAEKIRAFDQEIGHHNGYAAQLKNLKKGLMQDLLTGEVRTADKAIKVLEEVQAHG